MGSGLEILAKRAKNASHDSSGSGTLSVANRRRGGAGCMVGVHGHTTGRRAPRVLAPTASAECGLRRGVQLSLSRAGSDEARRTEYVAPNALKEGLHARGRGPGSVWPRSSPRNLGPQSPSDLGPQSQIWRKVSLYTPLT